MAVPLGNSFEGGSDGTTQTQGSGGNTGGGSGDYFDTVTIGASAVSRFAAAAQMHDTLGWEIVQPASAVATFNEWSAQLGTVSGQIWGRVYVRLASGTFSTTFTLIRPRNGATTCGGILLTSAAKVRVQDNLAAFTNSTTSLSVNTWYRIEWTFTLAAGAGNTVEARIYLGDSLSALETVTLAAATTQSQATNVQIGTITTPIASSTLQLDDISVNTVGYPGPSLLPSYIASLGRRPVPMIVGPDTDTIMRMQLP